MQNYNNEKKSYFHSILIIFFSCLLALSVAQAGNEKEKKGKSKVDKEQVMKKDKKEDDKDRDDDDDNGRDSDHDDDYSDDERSEGLDKQREKKLE